MTSLPPRVTVAMPVRNGESHLAAAVRSLLAQTFENLELLVSDNASTDGTADILAEFAAADARVSVVRRSSAVPAATNFNSLLRSARGHYFMWAADDDLWEPHFIERLAALLDVDETAALAFSAFANVDPLDASAVVRQFSPRAGLDAADATVRLRRYLMDDERDGKANLVYGLTRRSHLERTGGMVDWRASRWGADMLTVFRVLGGGRVAWDEDTLFRKRLAPSERPAEPAPDGSPVPLRQLPQWHGYLLGYLRIISTMPSLDAGSRRVLAGSVMSKLGHGDRAALQRLRRRVRRAA